jgi:hypothetical protein
MTSVPVSADGTQPIALKALVEQSDAQAGMPLLSSNWDDANVAKSKIEQKKKRDITAVVKLPLKSNPYCISAWTGVSKKGAVKGIPYYYGE